MADDTSNDNSEAAGVFKGPDPHGQAALLLVESLIHGLVARDVISVGEAVEIVDVATEVKSQIAADLGDSPATLRKSLAILGAIGTSLKNDLPPD